MAIICPALEICLVLYHEGGEWLFDQSSGQDRLPSSAVTEGLAMAPLAESLACELLGLQTVSVRFLGVTDLLEPKHRLVAAFGAPVDRMILLRKNLTWQRPTVSTDSETLQRVRAFQPLLSEQVP